MDRPFLVGKRIYLRPLDIEDLSGRYLQWVNDERIIRNMGTLYFPSTKKRLQDYLIEQLNNKDVLFFAIVEKKTGKHIGNVKLGPIDWVNSVVEYGRMIGEKSARGRGYGTEVSILVIKYCFEVLNLHKVFATPSAENLPSIDSNKKAGLKTEAILKEHKYKEGRYTDVCVMAITKKEYFKSWKDSSGEK